MQKDNILLLLDKVSNEENFMARVKRVSEVLGEVKAIYTTGK